MQPAETHYFQRHLLKTAKEVSFSSDNIEPWGFTIEEQAEPKDWLEWAFDHPNTNKAVGYLVVVALVVFALLIIIPR